MCAPVQPWASGACAPPPRKKSWPLSARRTGTRPYGVELARRWNEFDEVEAGKESSADRSGSPVEHDDFRRAIQPDGNPRPAQPAIDVETVVVFTVEAVGPSVTAWRQPERRNIRNSPLTGMAMPAEREVDMVLRRQLIQDIGRMCQDECETPRLRRRNTSEVRTVK